MRLKIEKYDEETGKKLLNGATFKIWDVNNQKWYEEMIYPSGKFISEFPTNDEGELTYDGLFSGAEETNKGGEVNA